MGAKFHTFKVCGRLEKCT